MILTKEELQANAWKVYFKDKNNPMQHPKLIHSPEKVDIEKGTIEFWVDKVPAVPVDLTPTKLDFENLPDLTTEEVEVERVLTSKEGIVIILNHDNSLVDMTEVPNESTE